MILDRLKRATWMRLDLLDRWLLKELLGPLLFFIALFTLLLLTGGVMFELVRQMVDKMASLKSEKDEFESVADTLLSLIHISEPTRPY